jgi:dihydrofolate reductase
MMYDYWSQITDPDNLVAAKLNGLPKYVASATLRDPAWQRTAVLSGDAIERVRELKQQQPGGELQVHGSCGLARALHQAGVVDEYRLLVAPVTVGAGKRLFTEDAPVSGYTLVESSTTSSGVVYSALRPASFAVGRIGVEEGREAV